MNTMYLVGTEEVQRAAQSMRVAADTMRAAADNLDSSLERHRQYLDEWLVRLEAAIDRLSILRLPAQEQLC